MINDGDNKLKLFYMEKGDLHTVEELKLVYVKLKSYVKSAQAFINDVSTEKERSKIIE